MSELVKAIDAAVAFVEEHSNEMTRAQVDEFVSIAADVYQLAVAEGRENCLPKVPELQPELESEEIRQPPQFISKLNLPGDWDYVANDSGPLPLPPPLFSDDESTPPPKRVFLPCVTPRWWHDMEILRSLASAAVASDKTIDKRKATDHAARRLSLDEQALALFIADSTRKKTDIAKILGVRTQSLAPNTTAHYRRKSFSDIDSCR